MWNFIKRMFGFGKKDESYMDTDFYTPNAARPSGKPPKSTPASKAVYKATYYRRNGNYYLYEDGSLLEDLFIIEMLMSMFDDSELEYSENGIVAQDIIEESETTVASIDAAVEEVRQETPTYSYVTSKSEPEPEPEKPTSSYSSSSYDSGSSSDSSSDDSSSDSSSSDSSSSSD